MNKINPAVEKLLIKCKAARAKGLDAVGILETYNSDGDGAKLFVAELSNGETFSIKGFDSYNIHQMSIILDLLVENPHHIYLDLSATILNPNLLVTQMAEIAAAIRSNVDRELVQMYANCTFTAPQIRALTELLVYEKFVEYVDLLIDPSLTSEQIGALYRAFHYELTRKQLEELKATAIAEGLVHNRIFDRVWQILDYKETEEEQS